MQPASLPGGLQRLMVGSPTAVQAAPAGGTDRVSPGRGRRGLPGGFVHVFLPGDRSVFAHGFPQLDSLRGVLDRGCVSVGIRSRVEYLRTTRGAKHDYAFDPDFAPRRAAP